MLRLAAKAGPALRRAAAAAPTAAGPPAGPSSLILTLARTRALCSVVRSASQPLPLPASVLHSPRKETSAASRRNSLSPRPSAVETKPAVDSRQPSRPAAMDVSSKKLALLKSFLDLATSASRPDLSALVKTNGAFFSDSLFDEDAAVAAAAAKLLAALAAQPRYRPALLAHGTASCLVRVRGRGKEGRRGRRARYCGPPSPFFRARRRTRCARASRRRSSCSWGTSSAWGCWSQRR